MGLKDFAKEDIEDITSDLDGFAQTFVLVFLDSTQLTLKGVHSKIHLGVDTDGNLVNSQKVNLGFSEKQILDAGKTIRNIATNNLVGEVNLNGYKFIIKDSTGLNKNYIVRSFFPDETIGYISCILENYG